MKDWRRTLTHVMPASIRLSLLDRSRTRAGEPDAAGLHHTIARAHRAEQWGYHRFWVAEHHGVPGIASGSPPVLLAAIGAATDHIRIGSGGVMLPNHAPFVVAEQFLMLEAMYPGRVDLGLGRSVGFTDPVRQALRTEPSAADRFGDDLDELLSVLAGTSPITARPVVDSPPQVFVLAMARGIEFAGRAGLPAVVGGSLLRNPEALAQYRERAVDDAHLIVSVDVMIAETRERARQLLLPEAWSMVRSRQTGEYGPLESVESVLSHRPTARQQAKVEQWLAGTIHGDADTVAAELDELIELTGADEIMSTASTFDLADLDASDAALAEVMGG